MAADPKDPVPDFLTSEGCYELFDPCLRQTAAPNVDEESASKTKPRVMAHCVIYAKTDEVMMQRADKVALVMV